MMSVKKKLIAVPWSVCKESPPGPGKQVLVLSAKELACASQLHGLVPWADSSPSLGFSDIICEMGRPGPVLLRSPYVQPMPSSLDSLNMVAELIWVQLCLALVCSPVAFATRPALTSGLLSPQASVSRSGAVSCCASASLPTTWSTSCCWHAGSTRPSSCWVSVSAHGPLSACLRFPGGQGPTCCLCYSGGNLHTWVTMRGYACSHVCACARVHT